MAAEIDGYARIVMPSAFIFFLTVAVRHLVCVCVCVCARARTCASASAISTLPICPPYCSSPTLW